MNKFGLSFHHLGLAVKDVDRALNFVADLGYHASEPVRDELQNVNLVFCTSESMPAVEIIWPTETSGPVSDILKFRDELIYHSCYESSDLQKTLTAIRKEGHLIVCISPPTSAPLFSGRKVSFYNVRGLGLIEILETG
jgi:catechol 2,3-dioxygenase-like lactoylglutathione lyase family enzyme